LDALEVDIGAAFRPLHLAAEWVFADATDQDTRHLLFAVELAHTLRASGRSLADGVPIALESAKAAYRAHLQSANRDTLRALAELRQAVTEETHKTVQRTQELTGVLWRDLLVAAAPFVLKILPDAAKIPAKPVAEVFILGAALYILGSFVMTTLVNRDYFREQDRSRLAWQGSLLRYLPMGEVGGISDVPIRAARKVYDKVYAGVAVFYVFLVGALILAASFQ
jgi:hypothetical protein